MTLILRMLNRKYNLNTWSNDYISPGPVSSVGDCLLGVRFAQSTPSLPTRWDPEFSGQNEMRLGSNVTDGQVGNFITNGGPPTLLDSNWEGDRSTKVQHGWVFQDLRDADRLAQPILGATPDYSWYNKLATNYNAKLTGDLFLPLPSPFPIGTSAIAPLPLPGQGPVGGFPIGVATPPVYAQPLPPVQNPPPIIAGRRALDRKF